MKKTIMCILLLTCILLCGCRSDSPGDYNGSKWVSNDPDMWFTIEVIIDEEAAASQYIYYPEENHVGEIKYNGQVYGFSIEFDIQTFIISTNIDGVNTPVIAGSFWCDSKKCTLKIHDKDWDDIFNGAYDEITLYRTE